MIVVDPVRQSFDEMPVHGFVDGAAYIGIAKTAARYSAQNELMEAGFAHSLEWLKKLTVIGPGGGGSGGYMVPATLGFTYFSASGGGGSLKILAKGLLVAGNIQAVGEEGQIPLHVVSTSGKLSAIPASGGGAGGVVILASATAISATGQIDVQGGDGGNGRTVSYTSSSGQQVTVGLGPGGGGGGGLIRLLAPQVDASGFDVSAGSNGSGSVPDYPGGGGGACAGHGGAVRYDPVGSGNLQTFTPGIGQVFIDRVNPAALLVP